ncbi:putative cystine transporter YijE [bacterium HR26]|nr:putative cystine transporter YijE [bacterium HR26]
MTLGQLAQLVLLGTIWGSSYLMIKVAVAGIPPLPLVGGRLVLGAATLLAVLALRGIRLPRRPAAWADLTVMALAGNIAPFLLIAWGEQHIDSGLAAVLNATTPFFAVLFAVLAFRAERFSRAKLAGLLLGFGGVLVLSGADLAALASSSAQGQLAILLSSACYGFGFAYARARLRGEPLALSAGQILVASALLAPPTLLLTDLPALELTLPRLAAWIGLGAVSSGLAYILYYRLIAQVGAVNASLSTYLMPPVGVTLGWLVLGEPIGWRTVAGVAGILAGLAVVQGKVPVPLRRPRRAPACVAER